MSLFRRSLHPSVTPILIAAFCVLCPGIARASSLNIHVRGDLIELHAEEVPLIDVIKTICGKTGIILKSSDPMTELVSLKINEVSVEECFRRLLAKRNFAFIYEGAGDKQPASVSLHVLGTGTGVTVEPEQAAPPAADPMKRYEKESFSRMFRDPKKISKQVSADGVEGNWPDGGGIRLTKVSKESALARIGLKEGDIVRDVNGKPVKSTDDLLEALEAPPADQRMIRIERLTKNGQIDPIYIQLR